MIFTRYTTAKSFLDDALEVLGKHKIQNNLIYKNIGDEPEKVMITIKGDDGSVLFSATRTPPLPMVMYETDNIRNDEVADFLACSLVTNNINVDFVMAEKSLAKSFCDIYGNLAGKKYKNNESLVLYVTDKVNDLPHIKGNFRQVTEIDQFYLPYWFADFTQACHLGVYDLNNGITSFDWRVNSKTAFIWEDEYPVSVAAYSQRIESCPFISQVYTPPHLRGKGYSTACVGHLTKRLLDAGNTQVALYADCSNPYSNAVYRKIGYKEVFWVDQYKEVKDNEN